ncbi:exodeoxyribonuclease VII small subunit [Candidatus Saccharibacteria bacterium]|jgi:exodeoxyribonuclease VII small subunit|nr:exodeoxyribonuclease VII small subunit [Candidatus Saccharibacteria bacterium]
MSEKKTISEKMAELDKDTDWFYSDEFNLDEAVEKYKKAIKIAEELQKDLSDLQNEVEVLSQDFSK